MTLEDLFARYEEEGFEIDDEYRASLGRQYARLTEEFGYPADEAIRNIRKSMDINFGLQEQVQSSIDTPVVQPIADITACMEVSLQGTIVALQKPASEKLKYNGILIDDTGAIRFTVATTCPYVLSLGRTYQFNYAKADNSTGILGLFMHKATVIYELSDVAYSHTFKPVTINDALPGLNDLVVKIVSLKTPPHPKALYQGKMGDASGSMMFTIWNHGQAVIDLKEGNVYSVSYAIAQSYQDRLTLDLSFANIVKSNKIIEVKPEGEEISGDVVKVLKTEIRRKCPVCGKVLNRVGISLACDTHGEQKTFNSELRTKVRLDNGHEVKTVIMSGPVLESLVDLTVANADTMAQNDILGYVVIEDYVHDRLFGRNLVVRASEFHDFWIAQTARPVYPIMITPGQITLQEAC